MNYLNQKSQIKALIEKTSENVIKSYEMNILNVFEENNVFSIKEFQRKY